mgnify:CR=1 FL=1
MCGVTFWYQNGSRKWPHILHVFPGKNQTKLREFNQIVRNIIQNNIRLIWYRLAINHVGDVKYYKFLPHEKRRHKDMNLTYWLNFVSFDNPGVVVTRWRPLFLKPILWPVLPTIFDPSFVHCQVIVGTTICVVAVPFWPNSQSWGLRVVQRGMDNLYEYILRTRIHPYGSSDFRILGGPEFYQPISRVYRREPLCLCLSGCRIIGKARRFLSYF